MTYQPRGRNGGQQPPGFVRTKTLYMPLAVWQQMQAYVQACEVEINGFGMVSRFGDDLWVDEVFITEQIVTAGTADVTAETLAAVIYEMTQNEQDPGRMRLQWHSHVNMEAYFSGTDLGNIEDYNSEWMVSLVTNKRGEHELRLDVFRPFRSWTPLKLSVVTVPDAAFAEHARREVAAKVRQPRMLVGTKPVSTTDVGAFYLAGEDVEIWDEGDAP